ncbi:cyclopropane-fatty-acyl-phospholipid synthase family protein [uncultured Tateyamaria sp.]|uniref:SAM-dependent methyltransferase n=1 Tax=uncultured Tateyamaria sp. TaxID=455651 RepID=UPI0026312A44|nr:class I SAM-dependent methyltransferase [uncultured Tateyamaria sp.]
MKSKIVAQFRHPSGLLGALAGRIMAARRSNRFRNDRTVDLMALSPNSRVLEVGCGPGLALARCASVVTSGRVVGLDHSDVMIRQARNRLMKQGVADRVTLIEGGIDRLADWPDTFDRIFSLNVIQFQSGKPGFFGAVIDALVPGGLCLTTYQPRLDADGPGAAQRMIASIEDALHAVGFENVTETEIIGGATPAICVFGQKSDTHRS